MPQRDRGGWILLGAVAVTLVLYVIPYGRILAYPLVLLSTFAHEMGHGVTALLAGGTFESFEMSADASGIAYLTIPNGRLARAATSFAGPRARRRQPLRGVFRGPHVSQLVGPAILAAVFFRLARSSRAAHAGLTVFGAATLLALVLVVGNLFAGFFVGVLGAVCMTIGLKSSPHVSQEHVSQAAIAFMAVQLSLSVFSRSDYLFAETAGSGPSDVAQMAAALLLPYWFWGVACGAISVVVLVLGLRAFLRTSTAA